MPKLVKLLLTILVTGAVLAGTVVAVAPQLASIATASSSEAEDIDLAALDAYAVRSEVLAADGTPIASLHAAENRKPVSLDKVPQPVIDAILAVEDAEFYDHNGVNPRAMARAFFSNVSAGGIEQGGSTITQQLVKNALLNSQRDLQRKTKEAALAIRLEQQLTKDQILEKYLNTVYFGAGAYGVQAAAETYWGVDVDKLGYAEGALLASLISNPVSYDPTLHPEVAAKRRQLALDRLVELGKIDAAQANTLSHAPLPVRRCGSNDLSRPVSCGDASQLPPEDYFVEQVKQQLLDDERLGATKEERFNAVFGGGLKVYTTLDPNLQRAAQDAHDTVVPQNNLGITSAMASVDSTTGAVRALVGGPGFAFFKYDIATQQPGRQTGSSFKVFVLLTALEQGNLPFDSVQGGGDFPNPGGYPNPYHIDGIGGTLASVTTASSNGAYVRIGDAVGRNNVIDMARRLGVTSKLDPSVISMPLGVFTTTPLEMASAYSTIPNKGVHEPAYFIDKVEDRNGKVIFQHQSSGVRAISAQTACLATDILQQNVQFGTGTRAKLPKQDAAGKTGTTQDFADAWFVGFTPYITTAVWMGNPTSRVPMNNIGGTQNFGGTFPAMTWQKYNQIVHENAPPIPFPACDAPTRGPRLLVGQGNIFANGNPLAGFAPTDQSKSQTGTTPTTRAAPKAAPTTTSPPPTVPPPAPDPGGGTP